MERRFREWLSQQATRSFVGRTQELEQLLYLLNEKDIPVVFVHGIGGIGKSSVLNMFAAQAQTLGAVVIKLDCRAIKPSAEGFLHELTAAIGGDSADVEQVASRLSQLGKRVILTLDTYELFRMMDTWLRQVFIPVLSDSVRVVLFGREAPVAAWFTTPGWESMFQSIELGPLGNTDAEKLLLLCGVPATDAERVASFTHGHPLALKLAAAAIAERPDLSLKEVESQRVITELAQLYLSDVRDSVARVALEAASAVRRITQSLIGAMLPNIAPNDAYDRLQALSFVESASDGLIIHDLVRQAIAARLRSADPERYYQYRRRAWQQLRSEFSVGSRTTIWRYTADMIYLIDNPGIHDAFFPNDTHLFSADAATADDEASIFAITRRHFGPEMLNIIQGWWHRQPSAFYVARGRQAAVGFYCLFRVQPLTNSGPFDDPITRGWWQHLQSNPIPEKQIALFCVCCVAAETGEAPSSVQGSLWLDIKRNYMEYPQTRRIYTVFQNARTWMPIFESLGFYAIDPPPALDGTQFTSIVNDFGPQLVPGWMASLVDAQLGVTPPVVLDTEARALVIGNERTSLTRLEFDLMHYLVQREEKVVSRDELLNTVWGYDYSGGSNVVDAMVRSLRKKLGKYAQCIDTVSGVGYKLSWH